MDASGEHNSQHSEQVGVENIYFIYLDFAVALSDSESKRTEHKPAAVSPQSARRIALVVDQRIPVVDKDSLDLLERTKLNVTLGFCPVSTTWLLYTVRSSVGWRWKPKQSQTELFQFCTQASSTRL